MSVTQSIFPFAFDREPICTRCQQPIAHDAPRMVGTWDGDTPIGVAHDGKCP